MRFGFLIIILLYCGANYYVASRIFRLLVLLGKPVHLPLFIIIFAAISASVLLSFLGGTGFFRRLISAVSAWWMGAVMYLLLLTAAAEFILLILRFFGYSTDNIKIFAELAVLVLSALVLVCGAFHARNIQTAYYEVDSGKAKEPLRIVLISDIHIGALGVESRLNKMVETINKENPDIICIAGDIFNNDFSSLRNPQAVRETLKELKAEYGVYACLGNHDCGNGFAEMLHLISDAGIHLLREETVEIPNVCLVCGRADASPIRSEDAVKRGGFDCSSVANSGLPVIVLDHNPAHLNEYGSEVSLLLCGHTHKGQLFPGSLITDSMYEADYGKYQAGDDKPTVIVSSGLGYWGPPLRVGSDSEIAVIELR